MKRYRAESLTFTLPESWHEVTIDQYLQLTDEDAPNTSAHRITTLSGVDEAEFRKLTSLDLDLVVAAHTSFLFELPQIKTERPDKVTIDSKSIRIPNDLGAFASVGQMWDVEFVIRQRESQHLPVDAISLTRDLLTIFLSPLVSDQAYTNRHAAAELWPVVGKLNCIDGLVLSAFFLHNFLNPSPSGKISVEALPIKMNGWQRLKRRALKPITAFIRRNS